MYRFGNKDGCFDDLMIRCILDSLRREKVENGMEKLMQERRKVAGQMQVGILINRVESLGISREGEC